MQRAFYKQKNRSKLTRMLLLIIVTALLTSCSGNGGITVTFTTSTPSPSATVQTPAPSPTEVPTPTPTPTPDPIEQRVSQMSDRELVGQMIMIGFMGTKDMDKERISLIKDYYVGNVIFFGKNTDTFSQSKKLIDKIKTYNPSDIPLSFAVDLEGGSVNRFTGGQWKPPLDSAEKMGKSGDPQVAYDEYFRIGEKLKEIGFTINLAPVCDISHDQDASFLGNRMFGSDPEEVSGMVRAAVRALHDAGIASLGKHFPGHGDTSKDSHKTLPVIDATPEEMENYSLIPFKAAIDEGVDAILVAHLSYPNVDDEYITSLSPIVIGDILRKQMGFEGVVLSDDFRMKGLSDNYSLGEAAVLFIQAGGDIVLMGEYNDYTYKKQKAILDALYNALQDGTLSRERAEQSVIRILRMKLKYQ